MKKCSRCKVFLDLTCFHKNKSRKDGLSHRCTVCSRTYYSQYYKNNPEKRQEQALKRKEWFKNNPEQALKLGRDWRKQNPEKCHEYYLKHKDWDQNHPEERNKRARDWRKKNPGKTSAKKSN